MIVKSPGAVPVTQFAEGWGNEALVGDFLVVFQFPEQGAPPEVRRSSIEDDKTIEVAGAIATEAEHDFRSLPHVSQAGPSIHRVGLRVGDLFTARLARNRALLSLDERRKASYGQFRFGELNSRPFLLGGRGITHTDISVCGLRSAVGYLLSNQNGTITYDQRFYMPELLTEVCENDKKLAIKLASLLQHMQARPGRAVQCPDDMLCRFSPRDTVHVNARQTHYFDTQRIFARDLVYQPE